MYNEFFGFKKLPFSITPDPNFVYMSSSHREALAQMMYGVQERKCLMVVSGEVGVGKTTMIFTLLSHLEKDAETCIIFDTHVDSKSLYRYIFADFKIKEKPEDRADATIILREHLTQRLQEGKQTLLILDEAHALSDEILMEVVFLTNMETMQNKLLQIILVGQTEINQVLTSHKFRQLRQRINLRTEIRPLTFDDTRHYIYHRVREAGREDPENLFTEESIALIYRFSKGLPRMINTICDNSLLVAYARKIRHVTPELVKETYADLMEIEQRAEGPGPEAAQAAAADESSFEAPPMPTVDSEGNQVLSEEVVNQTQTDDEQVRIVRRVVRTPDGREVVKKVRQIRRVKRKLDDLANEALSAGSTAAAASKSGRISSLPTLIPLPEDLPEVGITPNASEELLVAMRHDNPAAVRQYHLLWNRIEAINQNEECRAFIVSSSLPKEGKTITSINLAATIAQAPEMRVLLIDADLHMPRVHEYLGLPMPETGLANILEGKAELKECLMRYELPRLYYLPSGQVEGMPTELLVGKAMEKLLDEVKGYFHFIVVDSPPIVPIADTVGLAAMVDGTVLVCRARQTSSKVLMQAAEDLNDRRIVGIVLNALDFRLAGGYRHGYGKYGYGKYGYGYGYGYGRRKAAAAEAKTG
ncbi:MAG: polysaccharide biosynthesis tyrosine autokinase [Deltaproteobacteria bacterium]|nr:polysaccharide biosynthesis tyrosine autokinase [Deltaproteobacteria bacterium]MCB9488563.1 polysaccharide biosynthesis tyrosine autokinase [Deltaproteobacteria bacterium]